MRTLSTPTLLVVAVVEFCATTQAATLHTESFESPPGANYSLNTAFQGVSAFDFFNRYAVPDNSNAARAEHQNGWDGGFGIIGQDFDGDGGPATVSIDILGINITGKLGLAVKVGLGAQNDEPNFPNYEALPSDDGIEIHATIDGGVPVLIGSFKPNSTGRSALYQDVDLNGVGEGTVVPFDLATFTLLIPGTGNTLDLSIELTSTSSFETLAVDNVRVVDNIPEPTSLALALVTLCLAMRRDC